MPCGCRPDGRCTWDRLLALKDSDDIAAPAAPEPKRRLAAKPRKEGSGRRSFHEQYPAVMKSIGEFLKTKSVADANRGPIPFTGRSIVEIRKYAGSEIHFLDQKGFLSHDDSPPHAASEQV